MSCILRVAGQYPEIHTLLSNLSIRPYRIWHKGEPRTKTSSKTFTSYGACFDVSTAQFDECDQQVEDAIGFVSSNLTDLNKISSSGLADYTELDFGIAKAKSIFQNITLPSTFLKLMAKTELTVTISYYPSNDGTHNS